MKRRPERGLVMSTTRRISRQDAGVDKPPPPHVDANVSPQVAKAAGELTALAGVVLACQACPRADTLRTYGSGFPRAPVMLLKDRPSEGDLAAGCAFADEAEPLSRAFEALDIPLSWTYGTTAVRCGAASAELDHVKACATHLLTELEIVEPRVLVVFGRRAADALRVLDGRAGLVVPDELSLGERYDVRPGLVVLITEPMPDGVTDKEAKRRLWRDLKAIPEYLKA